MRQVYLCYTTTDRGPVLKKVVTTFKKAKAWQHARSEKLMELEILFAKYLLSLHHKRPFVNKNHRLRKNRHSDAYYKFLKMNELDKSETRSSPYFHSWELT